ncbi:Uncharacterized conserved protein YafD, endonuclease/exonuclease/phosphatase (EEP) superfamily [Frankineae bacterium MT45]|nr:Uncharacterized conserved protein YafD, endonuclease/exonuclease/phosphatase (EEP) superfamily [Frankineae bacterium MT45]
MADDAASSTAEPTRWWSFAGTVAGWIGVGIGLLGVLLPAVSISWQPVIVLAAFAGYLGLAAVVGGALLALQQNWIGVGVAVLAVIGTLTWQLPLIVGSPATREGTKLVVLQANLKIGAADPAALTELVRRHRVDVLTVEELTSAALTGLTDAGLDSLLPYRLTGPFPGGAGTGIWSRYPLADQTRHDDFTFELLSARVAVPGADDVMVWGVHLLPPWPYDASIWASETRRLHGLLAEEARTHRTVIVGGDFNATWTNRQFRQLMKPSYSDAAERTGDGWRTTYPTDRFFPPLLTLDHVLLHNAEPTSVKTVALPGSDHRGLLAELVLDG